MAHKTLAIIYITLNCLVHLKNKAKFVTFNKNS